MDLILIDCPARNLGLFQDNYHVGFGRAHRVSEAWIDDLCRWVVLDGQNGLKCLVCDWRGARDDSDAAVPQPVEASA